MSTLKYLRQARAVVPGVDHDEVSGPTGAGVAEVVEGAAAPTIAVGTVAASWARTPAVVAAPAGDEGLGQILDGA